MNRWTYYMPLMAGIVLVCLLNNIVRELLPVAQPWLQWTVVAGVAIAAGLLGQAVLIGSQGVFAQVLPVPGGRSIRGGGAQAAGWLLLSGLLLLCATAVLWHEMIVVAAIGVGILATIGLIAAGLIYLWNLPAAIRDFAED